jgi:hypothetical protein
MKVWEIHALRVNGAIRSTPDGEADVDGLVLSEKAYFLVMRDFRPEQLVALVHRGGVTAAARALVEHFDRDEAQQANGGRGLVITRSGIGGAGLVRADEREAGTAVGRRS